MAARLNDFFVSRRGSVSAVAQEVAGILRDSGYAVLVQDYDFPHGGDFVDTLHAAIKNSRDLIALLSRDYEESYWTRKELASFIADIGQGVQERRVIVLRCEDVPVRGLLAPLVYQDLVGITDPEERKRRILDAAEGRSVAASPPPRPFIGVPPRIVSFVGRAAALDRIDLILTGGSKPAAITQASVGRVAVQGMGGIGKTSLAIEYAHRFRDLYAGVWWCPSETRTGLLTCLAMLGVALEAVPRTEADIDKAAQAALRRLSEQRSTWLLVYDNVTAPDTIADLLPSTGARVLITSRFSDWAECAEEVNLDVLAPEEAVYFLQKRAGRTDETGATVLAEALGYLPLALGHAAAHCRRTGTQFADYAERAGILIGAAPRGAVYPRSVAATFDLAIAAAAEQCAAAERLMAFIACGAPERFPLTLVDGAIDDEQKRPSALAALVEVSLLHHDPLPDGTPAVTVHRLVQAVARARAENNGTALAAAARFTVRLAAIYPAGAHFNLASWPLCAQLTPHLLAQYQRAAAREPDRAQSAELLERAGLYFLGRAAYPGAEILFRTVLAIRESTFGANHSDTATALNNLAYLLQLCGDLDAARSLFERALIIRENTLGPEHPDTALVLDNIVHLLLRQADVAGAWPLAERALAIKEKILGPDDPGIALSLHNLANLRKVKGDFVGARTLYERALAIDQKSLGSNHPGVAAVLNNLASLMEEEGNLTAARALHERALTIKENALGPEHPDTGLSAHNLARLLHLLGDFAGAGAGFERALQIYERTLGSEHPSTATCLHNLASLRDDQGNRSEARSLYKRSLAIKKKALGPKHPDTAVTLHNLALTLYGEGDLTRSRALFEEALAITERTLGADHTDTNRVRRSFARLLLATNHPTEALLLGEAALAAHEKALGASHQATRDAADVTADALRALGRGNDAAVLRARYGLA